MEGAFAVQLNYQLLNWNVNLLFLPRLRQKHFSGPRREHGTDTTSRGRVTSQSEHIHLTKHTSNHGNTTRGAAFICDNAEGWYSLLACSAQWAKSKAGRLRLSIFFSVWALKTADVTTFEYLMQLKSCSVLLAGCSQLLAVNVASG